MRSKSFCVVPWVQLATNSSGNFRVCCHSVPAKNIITGSDGLPYKIFKDSVAEVWNADYYRELRQKFLDGLEPEICVRCFKEERSGVKSAREKWNERWKDEYSSSQIATSNIKYIDLRLGNLCNLRCRMCNPYSSNAWVNEWNSVADKARLVPPTGLSEEEQLRLSSMDWPKSTVTWDSLSELIEHIEEIYLTGGEPFLSLEQARLLEKIVLSGKSKDITLKYNTNLTTVPKKLSDLWAKFKCVRMNVSIDGLGALDEYIRFPSKWPVIEGNLSHLLAMRKSGCPLVIEIHATVQMYNILDLDALIGFARDQLGIRLYFNILNHPHCLNIQNLPTELKVEAASRLAPFSHMVEVNSVLSYMNAMKDEASLFQEFLNYTRQLDQNRKQSLTEIQPLFKPFF